MNFDAEMFKKILKDETRIGINKIIDDLQQEEIYSIGLYTNGEYGYIGLTCSTYKGLKKELKWSPCDSPYHERYMDILPKSASLLNEIPTLLQELYDEENDDWTKSNELSHKINLICLDVLKELFNEHILKSITNNTELVLNLYMGDQSNEECIENAYYINSDEIAEKFENELE
jgi:hypothetical protein